MLDTILGPAAFAALHTLFFPFFPFFTTRVQILQILGEGSLSRREIVQSGAGRRAAARANEQQGVVDAGNRAAAARRAADRAEGRPPARPAPEVKFTGLTQTLG
jgi:hypothetical protein